MKSIKHFSEIKIEDLPLVGGKNASLGEMYSSLSTKGIIIPEGFAVTADGYWQFMNENKLIPVISELLAALDSNTFNNLSSIALQIRNKIVEGKFPENLGNEIKEAYRQLEKSTGKDKTFAIRSSATAEDLPNASFAGQQETYLNVKGESNLIKACQRCYASLFTDRAIKYRADNNFDHMKVALSIGVQVMIRSDLASSGVMFTIDPDSGFEDVVLISGAWGLGENVVQGTINTDEFLVYKPFIGKVINPIIAHKLGSKNKTMVYSAIVTDAIVKPEDAVINTETTEAKSNEYVLSDSEIILLAQWACVIEKHYKCHMDIEWAKDGQDGKLYIVQARPEQYIGIKNRVFSNNI